MVPGPARFFHSGCRSGFTLLEILIAVSIFGVIATIVYSTFNAVLSRTDAIKQEAAVSETAAACLARISMDLRGLYLEQYPLYSPPGSGEDPDPYRFHGELEYTGTKEFPRLRFASTEHLPMSGANEFFPDQDGDVRAGIAEIRYHVQKDPETKDESEARYLLKRGNRPFPYNRETSVRADPEDDPVLCRNLTKLEFIYLDRQGNEHETWDSDDESRDYSTPRAVRISMEITRGGRKYSFSTTTALFVYRNPIENVKQ